MHGLRENNEAHYLCWAKFMQKYGSYLFIFFLFINFADNTLHYIKRQEQDLHNEIQYITTAGFPQQRIANYCGPGTKICK